MTKTVLLVLTGVALTMLTVAVASARHGGGEGWGPGFGMSGRIARHLDLSDEQRDQIRELRAASREQGEALRAQLDQLREDVASTIKASGFDEDQVRLMLENRSSLMIDLAMLRIRGMAEVYALLTPEQREKVDARMAQGPRGRHGRWHGHGHRHGPGDLTSEEL